jgi:peptidoglycan/xylan/chitin deacetylase (PgdA/CDA1 family)
MEKYEKVIRKNKLRKRRNAVIAVASLVILFFFGFFIGGKISHKKSVVVSAANVATAQKKNNEDTMNKRESIVTNANKNVNKNGDATFNPYKSDGKKVAYLTFDDGPSANNTPKILNILEKNNIKATFFVIGQNAERNPDLVKREISDGDIVGNHTYSHNMRYLYSNVNNFTSDLDKGERVLKSIIGNDYNLKLARFPGGSFGTRLAPYREAAKKAGYHYVDWNDLTGDAEHNNVPVSSLMSELEKYTTQDHEVILMHDAPAKTTTVQALPQVIKFLKSKGYTFETLK